MINKFLKMWNRFMYTPRFNIFDILALIIVTYLATTYSYWWFLLFILTCTFSAIQELRLEK